MFTTNTCGTRNEATRNQWLEAALSKIPAGSRILDAGAGELKYKKYCGHLTYVSQDFGKYDGRGNGRGLQKQQWDQHSIDIVCDIAAIPEPDASFDAIMCIEVLEHLPEPLLAITEFQRLLRQGGHLVITAPFCSLTHYAPYHFSTGFSSYYYEEHMQRQGFEILELQPNGNFFEFVAQELRRIPYVAQRYSGDALKKKEQACLETVLDALARFSGRDSGSDELLCFGYHLLAKKL